MKVRIDIDCTPEEARRFLGLPDVAALNEALTERLREAMDRRLGEADLAELAKMWSPGGMEGLQTLQKAFWESLTGGGTGGRTDDKGRRG